MSKQVDLTKPLSDEDADYLIQRGRARDVEANRSEFGGGDDWVVPADYDPSAAPQLPPAPPVSPVPGVDPGQGGGEGEGGELKPVEDMSNTEMEDELKTRGLPHSGNKAELQAKVAEARAGAQQ